MKGWIQKPARNEGYPNRVLTNIVKKPDIYTQRFVVTARIDTRVIDQNLKKVIFP